MRSIQLTLAAAILVTAVPSHAGSALFVAMNGIDSSACGGKKSPCRTISQAIANAPVGGTVIVGPGRYGDLDADGELRADPQDFGEEDPFVCDGASCALRITKALTVLSSDGPGATVLDGGKGRVTTMLINSSNVTLGRPKQGFTIVGAIATGILVRASDVRIEGNIITSIGGNGITLDVGDRATVLGNTIAGNGALGILVKPGVEDPFVIRNHIVGNGHAGNGGGIESFASGITRGNVITGNLGPGILVSDGSAVVRENLIAGNETHGVAIRDGGVATIFGNAIIGNTDLGVQLLPGAAANMNGNNIYGNDPHGQNCGVFNAISQTVDAMHNYWGAASGPGPNPADHSCTAFANSITLVDPVRVKPIKLRLKVAR